MPSPLLQLRIPQDLADWLEAKFQGRGEVAEYVRQLLTAEQMKEATAPLVPEARGTWKGTAAEWAAFQEGAGFETPEETAILDRMHGIAESEPKPINPSGLVTSSADLPPNKYTEPKPKARRRDVRKVPDQPVSVKNRGGQPLETQEPSSKNVKGGRSWVAQSGESGPDGGDAAGSNPAPRRSPSPKPRKPKTCQHSNTVRKLGMPFCEDCGEFV